MRRSRLLRASSSQSICNFCSGRLNPHVRHSSIARANAFHSTATNSQNFSNPGDNQDVFSWDLPDAMSEAQQALQQAKRLREEQEAARRKQEEDLAEQAESRKLFGDAPRPPPKQGPNSTAAATATAEPQRPERRERRQQFSERQRQQPQRQQSSQQPQQSAHASHRGRAVDSAANRPLNRVQTAQREVRNESLKLHRTKMQDRIMARVKQDKQATNMPSLDTEQSKTAPTPAQQPAPTPQFKAEPKPTVKAPSWSSDASTSQQAATSSNGSQSSVRPTQRSQNHHKARPQPSQPSEDSEDIFSSELDQARQAAADHSAFQTQESDPVTSRYAAGDSHSSREGAFRNREEQQRRQAQNQQEQDGSLEGRPTPQTNRFTELASSLVTQRPRIVMEDEQTERSPRSEEQSSSIRDLSAEEEKMLQALLARKNKSSAVPSTSSPELLFEEQDQQTRSALVVESKQRVREEEARQEERERRLQQNRGPRFQTVMVNARGKADDSSFDPEISQNWNLVKQQQRREEQPRRQEQESDNTRGSRSGPLSAEGIDARFEEYRRRRPRFGTLDIEALNFENRPTSDRGKRRREEQTCVRCGQPGHFFANCPNPPKPGWVDRTRKGDRGERGERRERDSGNAARDMAAAQAPRGVTTEAQETAPFDPEEEEAARRILERNARRASRFVEEDEDDTQQSKSASKGRRGRFEEEDEDDGKPRRSRRSRFEEDDDAEGDYGALRERRSERKNARQAKKDKAAKEAARQAARKAKRAEEMTPINLPEFVSVSKLAQLTNVRYEDLAEKMQELGFENTSHDHVLNAEEAGLIAMEYNFDPTVGAAEEAEAEERDLKALPEPAPEDKEFLPVRPPVVAIMGHVDHGKTTILDYLRKSSIAATEHGGITQHIGAFSVALSSGKTITFLDTPGHAAFLEMRKRGATVTDIIILVVAADDSVKPQTIEAIKHAKSANVPVIVAVNKIDKEEANVERVKQDLARHEVEIEDFGGDTQVVPVSGKTGQGIDELEDAAVTLSEILDHRADTEGQVEGWVLEATTKKAGRVATVLVRRGTLRPGSIIVAGKTWARVRSLRNEAGVTQMSAGPGTPVEVDGWRDQPSAGDEVLQAPNEQKASDVIAFRSEREERVRMAEDMEKINTQRRQEQEKRDQAREEAEAAKRALTEGSDPDAVSSTRRSTAADTDDTPGHQTVPFIIKADVSGSVEAVSAYLLQMTNPQCSPTVLRASVGPVTEFDIEHADAAGGHIISFNLPSDPESAGRAERKGIRILEQNVIYRIVDDVRGVLEEKLPPQKIQKVTGEAEVAMAFDIGVGGRKKMRIAGLKVRNGVVSKGSRVRVTRGDERVYDGVVTSLKNVKKDVQEMRKGTECGMGFEGWEGFQVGDMIQTFEERSEKRTLQI